METIKLNSLDNSPAANGSNNSFSTVPASGDSQVRALDNIAKAINNSQVVDRGTLNNVIAAPTQTLVTIASAAGGGALPIIGYVFNEDYLNATPTNNGSGAGSVVTIYNDGFNGNLISNITASFGNVGLRVKQLQIKLIVTASAIQDSAGISGVNPIVTTYNGDGTSLPQVIPLASAGNPGYQQQGFLVVNVNFTVKRYTQLSLNVPVGDTATVTIVYDNQ